MSRGSPFSWYQLLKNKSARSSAEIVVRVGMRQISEPRQSVIVKMQSQPSSMGSGLIKSMATLSPHLSGMGKGWSGPVGLQVEELLWRQSLHEGM
jgi:hypothetical protein